MDERLAAILDSISRHDSQAMDLFNEHFRDLREDARDRYEAGSTPEDRESARQEAIAYRKIIDLFRDARKIIEAKRERENAATGFAGAGSALRRGGIHTL